jgi:hypothetical protein
MFNRPDPQVLRSISAMQNHPNWDTVLKYLASERQATLERLAESPDTAALHTLQGRAAVLKEILDLAAQAESALKKQEAPKRLSANLF